ncbi:MAG: TauD/TfdA family dioxygenase [Pseudomonadota bacterium]|nr:TauD/TfdA family dioxygenase [Pseudomonadota bacterium]
MKLSNPNSQPDPVGWKPVDLANGKTDLTVQFSAEQQTSLRSAAQDVVASGRPLGEFTYPTQSKDALSEDLHRAAREVDSGRGIVILQGFPLADSSLAEIEAMYWLVGLRFGIPVSQSVMGEHLGHVEDVSDIDPDARAYRSHWELGLHTDISDIVSFLCVRRAASGGASRFASATALHDEMLSRHPDALEILYRGFHWHRLGEQTEGDSSITEHRVPFFSERDGYVSCRYIRNYIREAAYDLGGLTSEQEQALDLFDELARSKEFCLECMLEPGEAVVMNNHTILHARTAFEDGAGPADKRLLLRLWMASHNPRPTQPHIEGFGTGRAGGIAARDKATPSFRRRASAE